MFSLLPGQGRAGQGWRQPFSEVLEPQTGQAVEENARPQLYRVTRAHNTRIRDKGNDNLSASFLISKLPCHGTGKSYASKQARSSSQPHVPRTAMELSSLQDLL